MIIISICKGRRELYVSALPENNNSLVISTQFQPLFCLLLKMNHENSTQYMPTYCGCSIYGANIKEYFGF